MHVVESGRPGRDPLTGVVVRPARDIEPLEIVDVKARNLTRRSNQDEEKKKPSITTCPEKSTFHIRSQDHDVHSGLKCSSKTYHVHASDNPFEENTDRQCIPKPSS